MTYLYLLCIGLWPPVAALRMNLQEWPPFVKKWAQCLLELTVLCNHQYYDMVLCTLMTALVVVYCKRHGHKSVHKWAPNRIQATITGVQCIKESKHTNHLAQTLSVNYKVQYFRLKGRKRVGIGAWIHRTESETQRQRVEFSHWKQTLPLAHPWAVSSKVGYPGREGWPWLLFSFPP